MKLDPQKIDFFSLNVLCTVFRKRSFSGAGESLNLSQSVISYTIDRLRKTFHDQLFIRQGGGIIPTDRCTELVSQSENILSQFETMTSSPATPSAQINRDFKISCNFFERSFILPGIVKALRAAAPMSRLTVIQSGTDGLNHITDGTADLLIGPMRIEREHLYCRTLFRDQYVCVMDEAHPLNGTKPSLDDLLDANMVEVSYGEEWTSDYLLQLDALTKQRKTAIIRVPSPGDVHRIIQGTDLIAVVPRLYAEMLQPQLHIEELPFESNLRVDLVWTTRTHESSDHKWFRQLVANSVGT